MIVQAAIAHNIRDQIKKRGLKQKYIAQLAGFDEQTFSNMLNGRKYILAEYIPIIAEALGTTPNALYYGDEQRL